MKEKPGKKDTVEPFQTQPQIYKCHHCGSVLNDQKDFKDDADYYTCSECGVELYREPDGYWIYYKCPNPTCKAALMDQDGFQADRYWTCRNCGKNLFRDDEIDGSIYTIVDDEDEEEEEPVQEKSNLESCSSDWRYSNIREDYRGYSFRYPEHYTIHRELEWEKYIREKRSRDRKLLSRIILGLIIFFFAFEFCMSIHVGYSSDSLVGQRYDSVINLLEKAGFSQVSSQEIADLDVENIADDYIVTEVKLGWRTIFSEASIYPSNFPVTVTYHTLHTIHAPMSHKAAKGMNYEDVITAFQDAGFLNIRAEPQEDVLMGVFHEYGDVISVSIDDSKRFTNNTNFRPDVIVVVKYYEP